MNKLRGYRICRLACAALVLGSGALGFAQEKIEDTSRTFAPSPLPPGMLQELGGNGLKDAAITTRGYVAGGYTYNMNRPASGYNGYGMLYNDATDDPTINQVSFLIERSVTPEVGFFDLGFVLQGIYGSDARFTQANGSNPYGSHWANDFQARLMPGLTLINFGPGFGVLPTAGPSVPQPSITHRTTGQPDPENQFDMLQAGIVMLLPAEFGLEVRAGRFVTPWGLETVDPTQNALYSHSYIFSISQPKTLTGISTNAELSDRWRLGGGVVVGWDQSLEDNNDMPSFYGQVGFRYHPDTDIVLSVISGPEQNENRSDFRWLVDLTTRYKASSTLDLGLEGVIGYEPDAGSKYTVQITQQTGLRLVNALTFTGQDSLWAGLVGYVSQKLDEDGLLTGIVRAEYFDDFNGVRGLATEVYALTFGLNVVPFVGRRHADGFIIRPELRWEYANDDVFDDNNRGTQITLSADVIYRF